MSENEIINKDGEGNVGKEDGAIVFAQGNTVNVEFNNVVLRGGVTEGNGGAIYVYGTKNIASTNSIEVFGEGNGTTKTPTSLVWNTSIEEGIYDLAYQEYQSGGGQLTLTHHLSYKNGNLLPYEIDKDNIEEDNLESVVWKQILEDATYKVVRVYNQTDKKYEFKLIINDDV